MSLVHERAIPPPHLLQTRSASWPDPYQPTNHLTTPSSPASMSPQSLHSYMSRMPGSPIITHQLNNLPTSTWYSPSISAAECHNENLYASYDHFVPPHSSSLNLSAPTSTFPQYGANSSVTTSQIDPPPAAISPVSAYSRDSAVPRSTRPSEEPQLPHSTRQIGQQSRIVDRPHSSSGSLHSTPVEASWSMTPLGIQSSHDPYHQAFPTLARSPCLSEPLMELPSNHLTSPQPRRLYAPIAPQPIEAPRSHAVKRSRDDEDDMQDESKRRKRSDSTNSTQMDLSEEDKLLLQLKEEDSMPWKDIAARFQSDLGKTYQIPALQMRLKRLRERMRVWTDTDVRALRMAHEYWAQNKFDIISQKMLEFGAQEKWTARQCARKWSEIDPTPTPYAHYEQHLSHSFAPYSMSPVEPSQAFLPYMHV